MTPTIGSLALLLLNSLFFTTLLFSDSTGIANLLPRVNKKTGRIQPGMGIVHVQKIGALTMSLWLFCKCKKSTIFVDLEEKKTLMYASLVYTHNTISVNYTTNNEI